MALEVNRRHLSVTLVLIALLLGSVLAFAVADAVTGASNEPSAVASRFFDDLHTGGDLDVAQELVAPGAFVYTPDGTMRGPAGIAGLVSTLRTAFPDATFPIAQTIEAGEDVVLVRWTMQGTHQGEFLGIAPTGTRVTMTGIAILTVRDGKIVEDWVQYDRLGLLQQLEGTWTQLPRTPPCGTCGPAA